MTTTYPHTIENCVGEMLTFESVEKTPEGDKVIVDAFCEPGAGPAMHVHHKQDEELTVVSGRMGYQILGQQAVFIGEKETILFKMGTPHKFWAEGDQPLHCKGWIKPADNVAFFLSAVYAAQNKSGKAQPEMFDSAYLLTRYAKEYDMPEIPSFVKKTIFPLTYMIGRLLGKYNHFKDAPTPLK